jgi:hypothetical protein
MFTPAAGKARTGAALNGPGLRSEGWVTLVDGILATAVRAGLVVNAALGWWADPAVGYVRVYHAVREVRVIVTDHGAVIGPEQRCRWSSGFWPSVPGVASAQLRVAGLARPLIVRVWCERPPVRALSDTLGQWIPLH